MSYLLMDSLFWYISGTFLSIPCSFAGRATLSGIVQIIYLRQGNNFFPDAKWWNAVMLRVLIPITCGFYYLKGYQKASKNMAFCCLECCKRVSINYEKDRILISICSSRFLHMQLFWSLKSLSLIWEIQFSLTYSWYHQQAWANPGLFKVTMWFSLHLDFILSVIKQSF